VQEYLDRPPAPQISSGRVLPNFSGKVCWLLEASAPTVKSVRQAWMTALSM
jgi:hypothetical protein